MCGHNHRADGRPLRLALKSRPGGYRTSKSLKIEVTRCGADKAIEDQGIARSRADDNRRRPERPPCSTRLLTVVAVVCGIKGLFVRGKRENHCRRASRVQPLVQSRNTTLHDEVAGVRP